MTTDKNNRAPDPQPAERANASVVEQIAQQWDGCQYDAPGEMVDIGAAIRRAGKRLSAELAEQQGVSLPPFPRTYYDAFGDGSEPLYTGKQMQDYARAAIAATGAQQVGEVQGAVPAQSEAWAVSIGAPTDKDEHGNYLSSALNYSKLGWDAALAARQPGAQADEAAILRHGAAVLDMWEGDPHVTGYMGDFKDACAILEVLALHAAPPAQGIDLGQSLRNLVDAAKYMRDRVVETRGAKCMDDLDYAINEADKALIDGQRGAAPGVGNG